MKIEDFEDLVDIVTISQINYNNLPMYKRILLAIKGEPYALREIKNAILDKRDELIDKETDWKAVDREAILMKSVLYKKEEDKDVSRP